MSEWWNLDQALIWIATRDLRQVDLGQGDPEGIRERASNYFSVIDAGIDLTADPDPEPEPGGPDAHGEGAMALLIRALRGGLIRAVRPDDETGTPIASAIFTAREIEPYGPQPIFVLAKPRKPIEAARGAPQTLLMVVLSQADVIAAFPPRAPDHLIPDLAALAQDPKPEPKPNRSKPSLRAEAILRERHPHGLPKGEGYGKRKAAIAEVQKQLSAEGFEPLSKQSIERLDRETRKPRP